MAENPHTEQELDRLTWIEQHIRQLAEHWRAHAAQLRRQTQPMTRGDGIITRAEYAATKVEACARDVEETLAASRLPGPPLTAAFIAAQVIRWTRALERLCGTVDAEIAADEVPGMPSVEDGARRAAEAVRAVAASYAAAGQPQPDGQTEAAIAALTGQTGRDRDELDDIDETVTGITDADITARLTTLTTLWRAKAGRLAFLARDVDELMDGMAGAFAECATELAAVTRMYPQPAGLPGMWRAEVVTKERQLREYDAMAEDLEALRDQLEDSPDADVCAAGVRLRAVLDDGGQDRLARTTTRPVTPDTAYGWDDQPATVTVSRQDLRDALEDWGYEGPVDPPEKGLEPAVFRLTRAAYSDAPADGHG